MTTRTCTPAALLALALALPAAAQAPALPSGASVMDRFVEATGGKAAYASKHTMLVKGTMEMAAMGLKGTMTLAKAEPDLQRTEIEFQGLGKMLEGFDGTTAWAFSALQGPQVKTGEERAFTARSARFHTEDWKQEFKEVKTLALEPVEGEPCYKVQTTPHQGDPGLQFFSVKTGLLVKAQANVKTAMGEIAVESFTRDYRKAGDVLVAHTLVQSFAGQTITLRFEQVSWNVDLPKAHFDPPAEVKALIKP